MLFFFVAVLQLFCKSRKKGMSPNLLVLGANCNHSCVWGVSLFCIVWGHSLTLLQIQSNSSGLPGKSVGGEVTPSYCARLTFCLIFVRRTCLEHQASFI